MLQLQINNRVALSFCNRPAFELFPVAEQARYVSQYGFNIYAGYPEGAVWKTIREHYGLLMALLLLLSVASAAGVYWMLGRVLAPSIELQRALSAGEFIPYYQPVVCAYDNSVAGVEVLMRWQHPAEGLISPDSFIPLAERSGLIVPMTRTMMNTVARDLKKLATHLEVGFHIAFNISSKHFETLELVKDCETFLATFAPGSVHLVLELTERELIESTEVTDELVSRLRAMDVAIAMDDFGTGHSSLSYLQKFQFDFVKIDRSFVSMIGGDALSVHILDSIVELALKLDLQLVAEGIETEEQGHYLGACGVEYLQGFLYARPMPASDFAALMQMGRVKLG